MSGTNQQGAFDLFVKAMAYRDAITDDEVALLAKLPTRRATYNKGAEIVAEHARAEQSCIMLSGVAARAVYTIRGQRQLTALHIAGDFIDLHALLLKIMDHSVVAMSSCEVAFVDHEALLAVFENSPHLGRIFWLSTVIDAAIQRAWTASIGRRTPAQSIGHLLCELYVRFRLIGHNRGQTFDLPLTQSDLADLLGLSIVHVNRKVRELREAGLARWDGTSVTVPRFETLAEFSEFDPTYLSLNKEPR